MFFSKMMPSSSTPLSNANPYGLSGPELQSVTNGGNYHESAAAQTQRLQTDLTLSQARVRKLEGLVAAGHTVEPTPVPLDAAYTAGGKFALSGPEQAWATRASTSHVPLTTQLAQKQQHVEKLQGQLEALANK